ncbi:hypothetical protein MSAR_16990 [Mycolicibacterium sarraceniae]|uniref:Uncharacterized protein n=1 Tax=Mycolicibacterium sarraceniae TaxID=1534348 RepID=A0A7I7SP83_9MYCO|nr:hypothetical protein MSAR_16990 [Mycolicibacterium sarraceniae]
MGADLMSDRDGGRPGWLQSRARHWQYSPPLKTAFAVTIAVFTLVVVAVLMQFRGDFVVPPKSWRVSYAASGLVLDSLIS